VPRAYKCRVREPWWRVPGVTPHDFVIGVLSTAGPRIVGCRAPATNSLLVGDLRAQLDVRVLSAAGLTSWAALSAEVTGHALGGGALKLEPAEARRWRLPLGVHPAEEDLARIDGLLRAGEPDRARAAADRIFLAEGLGLDAGDVRVLWEAVVALRAARRRHPHAH
jgi:adenine-specific DNA-methyltransferase